VSRSAGEVDGYAFIRGSPVRRLNVGWFCDFGAAIYGVANIPMGSALEGDVPLLLTRAKDCLEIFEDADTPLSLDVSRPTAEELRKAINLVFLPGVKRESQVRNIAEARKLAIQLQLLLASELNRQPIYHVFPKRAYDINILIQDATKLFSESVRKDLSKEAIRDIAEAGRCLAFELPTAAAFHLMRAAEAIIREYYALIVGELPKVKHRNWGAYIKHLREKSADEKIMAALEQIKDLHRNPILHPELQLELEEVVSLVGIIESVMSAMMIEIQKLKQARGISLAPPPPSPTVVPMPNLLSKSK
jgi:hypothetical protein